MWRSEYLLTNLTYLSTKYRSTDTKTTIEINDTNIQGSATLNLEKNDNRILYSIESTEQKSCFEFAIYTIEKVAVLLSIAYNIEDLRNCDMELKIGKPSDFFMAIFEKVCYENDCIYAILDDDAYIRKCASAHGIGNRELTNKMILTTGKWFYHKWGYMPIYTIDMERFDLEYDELQDDYNLFESFLELFDANLEDVPTQKDFLAANFIEQDSSLLDFIVDEKLSDIVMENKFSKFKNTTSYKLCTKMNNYFLKLFKAVHVYFSKTMPDELEEILKGKCAPIQKLIQHKIDVEKIPFPPQSDEYKLLCEYPKWYSNFNNCQIKYFKVPT